MDQAVKQGAIQFRPTTEGAPAKLLPATYDEDSSDTAPSPLVDSSVLSPLPSDLSVPSPSVPALIAQFTEPALKVKSVRSESLGDININQYVSNLSQPDLGHLARSDSFGGSGANLTNFHISGLSSGPNLQRGAPGKDRKKLKSKAKPLPDPKTRTIKFHEYKVSVFLQNGFITVPSTLSGT